MRIAVCDIQPATFPVGGQQIEIVNYAETFVELGHEVDLYFNDESQALWPEILRLSGVKKIGEIKPLSELDRSYDLYFSGYPWINLPDGVPVISWWIDPYVVPGALFGQGEWLRPWERYSNLVGIWTLSDPMRDGLVRYRGVPDEWKNRIYVFPAPLRYDIFRGAALPTESRDISLLFVGRDDPAKHPEIFVEVVERLGRRRARMFFPEWPGCPKRSELRALPSCATVGASRREIAEAMGRARVVFVPSDNECASLVVYEALNAGCYVIASDVGSIRWQLGTPPVGAIFSPGDWETAEGLVRQVTSVSFTPVAAAVRRGFMFDRMMTAPRIKGALMELGYDG